MKRVAIVDDHGCIAHSLGIALEHEQIAEPLIIDITSPSALHDLVDGRPDLCLVDLDLGEAGATGMDFLLAARRCGVPVVIFTGSIDAAILGRCIEAGALGAICKRLSFPEVVRRIERVLQGGPANSDSEMLKWVLAAQRDRLERQRRLAPFERLTRRERIVLQHLVDGDRVDQIAEADFVSVTTVRTQVRAILQKLGVQSQIGAIANAHRAGWSNTSARAFN